MRTKCERIFHKERLKKNRKNYWGGIISDSKFEKSVIDTPAPCSCWMCGNPRKYFNERTIQEKRFEDIFESYITE